ncbi:PREDICTED: poly [ADP-ribose] polymerase 14-like isoform X1 [Branchiostoma belcheri]|uniref:Poly [ADP-ribose] polymerase n=1 Tax=Branchiostoma belcheri TaxID=7741 RepID=A0A6P4ZIV6_BRABE|nr:PREDICTED: poly [ADP-ribose] polymerase 14-like isoform X1 [Branchiostoma belcheri]
MGAGASKKTKRGAKDDSPATFTVPSAPPPPPAFNPECPPQGLPPQQPPPHAPLYPSVPTGNPVLQPNLPPGPHGHVYAVPPHVPVMPHPGPPAAPSPDGGNEYFMETPSIEVLRTGEPQVNTDTLRKYFSHKKSHGGKISSITEDDDCFVIKFEDMDVAQDVLSHTHVLEGTQLHVCYRKSPTIEVITDGTIDQDRLKMYFKNTHVSGGGPIDGEIKTNDHGVCYITFQNKRAAIDVVQKSHSIDGQQVVVSEKLSLIDRRSLLIKDIPPDCSSGHLRDYLEGLDSAQGRLHIAGLYRGNDDSVAVLSLRHDIDGKTRNLIAKEAKREPLKRQHVSVSPMVVTRSVQLSGINQKFTRDLLLNYFENTERSGGGKVLDIAMDKERGMATIWFKDPTVVQTVVRKPQHQFDCGRVFLCAHYDVLGTITDTEFFSSSEMPFDPNVPRVLKRNKQTIANIEPSKLCLLKKQLPSLATAFPNVDFDIKHDHITIAGVDQEPTKARDNINEKLQEFKECRWSISDDLQFILSRDHTKNAIDSSLAEANVQIGVHFSVENNEVVIWGVDDRAVTTAESCVRSTFKESSMKIPKEILELRNWDDLMTQCKEDANRNATVSYDKTSGVVNIVGLIPEVDEINRKLVNFLKQNDFKTSVVRAERPVVNVLVKRQKDRLKKIAIDNEVSVDDTATGFKILGPQDRMKKVSDEIEDLTSKVMKTTVQYKKPGLGKLFTDDTFKMQLKKIEDDQGCAIQFDCKTKPPLLRDKTKLKDFRPSRPSVGGSSNGPISVDIGQGNIESESADVIVNPVTNNSAFTVVGGALVKVGGQRVKDEFERNWSKRLNGVLLADAGTLRCKTVAHMELPSKDKLKDAVCQCLVLSAQAGMKSIAFPAIGTGRYGITSIESAKAIRDGIEKFLHQNPAPLLTDIRLTVFVQQMVADYKAEFRTPLGGSPNTGITRPSPGQQEMKFGAIQMQVQQGDISKERTEVVVSTILKDMEFTVVTKALVTAGGQSIADQLKTAWPSRTDRFVFTDAGTLPIKKVAHMVLPSASELKDAVASCLRAADKLGMKSISFPAIGTGGTMSVAESAKGIYSGVQEFGSQCNPKSLKLVRVTIFDGKMLGTFHSTMQQFTTASYNPPTLGAPTGRIGNVAVEIQQGDLAKETTDAIVNPVNTDGGFFVVGNALEQVGGPTIRTDCQTSWKQRTNEVLVTDGGNLPCKKVIHAVCPNARAMKGRVLECLLQAEVKGLASVSFPAIGTGGFGVSVADAARETILGIKEFAITCSPKIVKLVRVTVFQAQMVAEFQNALQAAVPKPSVAPAAPTPQPAKMTPQTDVEQVVDVTFYACDKRDTDTAIQKVSGTIDKHMTRERVDDDRLKPTIRHLQQNEKESIIQMGADYYLVLVTITGHDIVMVGLKDDVAEARRKIESFLWEKKTAYDTEQLKKDIIKVPDYWATPPRHVKGAYMHLLNDTSQEYKDVQSHFLVSVGYQPQIVSISRVQNESKYKAYITELKERRKTCARRNIEELLYHGTAAEAVDNINQGGFNRSYCGKNATAYGDGVYFAKHASYSAQDTYSPPDAQGDKHIYQARVIVGEYTAGKSGLLEPPPKNPSNAAVRYDSVVDNVKNPSIFVVFHDTDAYPEYHIVFK